jgi:hypothetical protein
VADHSRRTLFELMDGGVYLQVRGLEESADVVVAATASGAG